MKRIRRKRDRPLADRAREAEEELERGAPRVARFSDDEEAESGFAAGVAAAGESDRPVGTSVEYPSAEPRSEIDVDRVFGTVLEDPDAPEPTAAPSERPRE